MVEVKDTNAGREKAAKTVKELQERAFKLKHFGDDIKKVFNEIDEQKSRMPDYAQGPTQTTHKKGGSRKQIMKAAYAVSEYFMSWFW